MTEKFPSGQGEDRTNLDCLFFWPDRSCLARSLPGASLGLGDRAGFSGVTKHAWLTGLARSRGCLRGCARGPWRKGEAFDATVHASIVRNLVWNLDRRPDPWLRASRGGFGCFASAHAYRTIHSYELDGDYPEGFFFFFS